MAKLTAQQKTKIRQAKATLEKLAETLQEIQDSQDDIHGNIASTLEEIGISIGFCIGEIDDNLL